MDGLFFQKIASERVSRYGAGLQKSIYCFMVQKDFQKDTINCKGNVILIFGCIVYCKIPYAPQIFQ